MSGHSKWSNIKHRKQAQDVKRSKIFQKLSKEILISIKNGGVNVDYNSGLRNILSKAKSLNMPKSRIDALIKTASSKKEQVHFEEILYEAYLPGGVAVIIESITDNKNRTTPVVKTAISKVNGNLSPSGSVVRLFHRKGLFNFENNLELDENAVFEKIIDLQIDELTVSEDSIQILTLPFLIEIKISLLSFWNIFDLFTSWACLRCFMFDHFECPDTLVFYNRIV